MMQFVEFASGPNTLRGMLHLPAGPPPHPTVMFCHGFTGQRMESHFLFVTLARALETGGMAALRFDFAGSGESDGEFADMTPSAEIEDASSALDFLLRHPAVDASRLGALGLSLGGLVAAGLAARRGGDLRAAALLAPVGDTPRVGASLILGEFQKQLAQRGYMDMHGLKVPQAFLDDFVRQDPAADLAGFEGPALVIHGAADNAVPVDNAHLYAGARSRKQRPTELHILEGADHTFNNLQDTATVTRLVVEFFARHLSAGG